MAFQIRKDESVTGGVRRIAHEQVAKAVRELGDPDLGQAKAVHQFRKRCKKLRGLVRLVRPGMEATYARENASFRSAAAGLSELRDATVLIESYDLLMDAFAGEIRRRDFGWIRRKLTLRHRKIAERGGPVKTEDLLAALRASLERVDSWEIESDGPEAMLAGDRKTYARGRKAMAAAFESREDEAFHEWRKRVKYHGYHTRLLRAAWPPLMKKMAGQLGTLGDLLGDDHDLAVLRATVLEEEDTFGRATGLAPFLMLIEKRQTVLRDRAQLVGARLFAEKPKAHARRLRAWWQAGSG